LGKPPSTWPGSPFTARFCGSEGVITRWGTVAKPVFAVKMSVSEARTMSWEKVVSTSGDRVSGAQRHIIPVRIGLESMPVLGSISREIMTAPSGLLSWKYNACFPGSPGEGLVRGIVLTRVPVRNTTVAKVIVQR
jgi:hypothetical protein